MKNKTAILVLLILVILSLSSNLIFAKQDSQKISKKDPFLAGALSFYNPGLGQYYVGEVEKGTIFWIGENILFWSALLTVMDLSFKFKKDFGFEFKIKQKANLSDERIIASVSLGIAFLALHIYNIIDAVDGAKRYNRRLEQKLFNQQTFNVGVFGGQDGVTLFFSQRF